MICYTISYYIHNFLDWFGGQEFLGAQYFVLHNLPVKSAHAYVCYVYFYNNKYFTLHKKDIGTKSCS